MKYDHAVKFQGVFYSMGADVPVEDAPQMKLDIPMKEVIKEVKTSPRKSK